MKKKIILPFLSLCGVAVTITPLICSCSKSASFSFDSTTEKQFNFPVSLRGGYFQSYSEASSTYFADIEKNPKIFCADINYSFWRGYEQNPENLIYYKNTVTIKSIDTKNRRLSYSIDLNFKHKYGGVIQTVTQKVDITNCLIAIGYSDYNKWETCSGWINNDAIWLDHEWTIHYYFHVSEGEGRPEREEDITANWASKDTLPDSTKGNITVMLTNKYHLKYLSNTAKLF